MSSSAQEIPKDDSHRAAFFFKEVTKTFCHKYEAKKRDRDTAFIIVSQALPDALPYLLAYKQLGKVAAIIPKSASKRLRPDIIEQWREAGLPVREEIDRDYLRNEDQALAFIKQATGSAKRFVIVDHSGYFSHVGARIDADEELNDKYLG